MPQDDAVLVKCLFDDRRLMTEEVIKQAKRQGFDFIQLCKQRQLDHGSTVQFINYIRQEVAAGKSSTAIKSAFARKGTSLFNKSHYIPVIPNDPLLWTFGELMENEQGIECWDRPELIGEIHRLKLQIEKMQASFRKIMAEDEKDVEDNKKNREKEVEDDYFESYSTWHIHLTMLQDRVRTLGYKNAIDFNAEWIKGKTVLDVGCGTGVLSIFCAKAGARRVFGVDNAEIVKEAKEIVKDNKLGDRITLIKGLVEDVKLPEPKVDLIVSEWMGYFLFFESMLSTVIFARDKWLRPGGRVFPNRVNVKMAGFNWDKQGQDFWKNVYDIDMTKMYKRPPTKEALVCRIGRDLVQTDVVMVKEFNIETVKEEEVDFGAEFILTCKKDGPVDCIVSYFDTFFDGDIKSTSFSTGPFTDPTHWKQTVFVLDKPLLMKKDDSITIEMSIARNEEWRRCYDVFMKGKTSNGHSFQQLFSVEGLTSW